MLHCGEVCKTANTETNSYAKNKQNSVWYLLPLKRTLDQHTLRWLHVHEVQSEPSPSQGRPRHVAKLRVEVQDDGSPRSLTAATTQISLCGVNAMQGYSYAKVGEIKT